MNTVLVIATLLVAAVATGLVVTRRLTKRRPQPQPRLAYTHHLHQRMVERGITSEQVEAVVASPDRQRPDPRNGSVRLERDFDDETLIVWVAAPWPTREHVVLKSSAWANRELVFTIPAAVVGRVIGRGGSVVREIEAGNGVRVKILKSGEVHVLHRDEEAAEAARREVLWLASGAQTALVA